MGRWGLLSIALLAGCEGERVGQPLTDAGTPEVSADAGADTGAGDECGTYRGAKMVRIGAFCIDTTEVTRGQFLEFLAAPVADRNAAKPAECSWNKTDPPIVATASELGRAVDNTNFCDAIAYCAWANKRLCGRLGGGALPPADFTKKSEWFSACSPDGAQPYPYGDTYSASRCFTQESTTEATGTRTTCAGAAPPYSFVFDLVGNAAEWENSCTGSFATEATRCRTRGGTYGAGTDATCAKDDLTTVSARLPGVGFRCCKD